MFAELMLLIVFIVSVLLVPSAIQRKKQRTRRSSPTKPGSRASAPESVPATTLPSRPCPADLWHVQRVLSQQGRAAAISYVMANTALCSTKAAAYVSAVETLQYPE